MAETHIHALRSSVTHLQDMASQISEADLTSRAYPEEWTVAQVLSHLGSGAVITQRRLEDTLAGSATPDDHAPSVWEAWNAKTAAAQRDEALAADAALLERIEATDPDERARFAMSMGPLELGFTEFVGMRLNEHAIHTWDIEVVGKPDATLPAEVTGLVVDNLELVARYTAKPTGETTTVSVTTTNPDRGFTIDLTPDSVAFQSRPSTAGADLTLRAEAFSRLIYGRLDAAHVPAGDHGTTLATLRHVFPGP